MIGSRRALSSNPSYFGESRQQSANTLAEGVFYERKSYQLLEVTSDLPTCPVNRESRKCQTTRLVIIDDNDAVITADYSSGGAACIAGYSVVS